jgi:hypothetical protein
MPLTSLVARQKSHQQCREIRLTLRTVGETLQHTARGRTCSNGSCSHRKPRCPGSGANQQWPVGQRGSRISHTTPPCLESLRINHVADPSQRSSRRLAAEIVQPTCRTLTTHRRGRHRTETYPFQNGGHHTDGDNRRPIIL